MAAFNRYYAGRLEVGRVTGNLVQDLFARDVRLYDPAGRLVLAIDSVVLRPQWRALFQRAFVADEVVLFRPRLDLVRAPSGVWNLAEALRERDPGTEPPRPFAVHTAEVRVVDGAVTTANAGSLPAAVAAGTVFDYTNVALTDLDATLLLDVEEGHGLLGVERLSARLPRQGVEVETLAGRLALEDGRIEAEGVRLVTSRSRLRGRATVEGLEDDAPRLDVTVREGAVHAADLRAFLPRMPLADRLTLSGRLQGPLDALDATDLVAARGLSRLRAAGRVTVTDSVAFDLTLGPSSLRVEDLAAVVPSLRLPPALARLDRVDVEGDLNGAVEGANVRIGGDLTVASAAGTAEGTIEVAIAPGRPLRLVLDAAAEGVDSAALTGDPRLAGRLSGRVALRPVPDSAATRFRLALGPSTLAGRAADSLLADGAWGGGRITATVALQQGSSRLSGRLAAEPARAALRFEVDLTAFDLQRLLPTATATALTGPVRADLVGPLAALRADVEAAFTEAKVTVEGRARPLPTGPLRLTASPPGEGGPTLHLTSSLAEATFDGALDLASTLDLGAQWGAALARTAAAEVDKPLHGAPAPRPSLPAPAAAPPRPFSLALRVFDPDGLRALLPSLPRLAPGTAVDAEGLGGGDTLSLRTTLTAPALDLGSARFDGLAATVTLNAPYDVDWPSRGQLRLEARADSVHLAGRAFPAPEAGLWLEGRRAGVALDAGLGDGAVHLAGTLDLLPDRNRFHLAAARLDAAGFRWTTADGPQVLDLYRDAAAVRRFVVQRADEPAQRVAFGGTLSASPADTLYAAVEAFELRDLASAAGVRPWGRAPGGRLDARLAMANVLSRPEVTGRATVPQLLLGEHVLGRLDAESQFVPGAEGADAEGVAVDLRLAPPDGPVADSLHLEENRLHLAGRVRFPGGADDGARDAGLLDLTLDAKRVDLFFFDLLFPGLLRGSEGYTAGRGHVGGDFSFPVFEAALDAREAATAIPAFGLALEAEGPVRVDRLGIHLDDVAVTDKRGGAARVAGSVLFNGYRFFSLDLTAALHEVEVMDVLYSDTLPFYGHLRASGTLSVTGPLDRVLLRSIDAVTTPDSELFIPVAPDALEADRGFLVFADALGRVPERAARTSLIGARPAGERTFTEGLEMSLDLTAPPGSTVHLVLDPRTGEAIRAEGRAELQLALREGRFLTTGVFTASGGEYVFTAGDVFARRFEIEPGGTLVWEGDPLDARLDLAADYRTRASLAGLGLADLENQRIPLVVRTRVGGRLRSPLVSLALEVDADARANAATAAAAEALRPLLNDPDRQPLYATSVLLTGTFLLAPVEDAAAGRDALGEAADDLLFASLSELVASRLNVFLSQALASDAVEVLLGLQPGQDQTLQDFDLTYGVALRLLDERLVIRGQGVYQQLESRPLSEGIQGEVAVEVLLTPKVALEVFYRREGDPLSASDGAAVPYGAYGASLSYETPFSSWRRVLRRLLGV